jgi:methyltransferase (TIGR00027 family)
VRWRTQLTAEPSHVCGATQLGGEATAQALVARLGAACADVVVARCLDAALLNAACGEGVRQAVVVGHGADTRAFRLLWPSGVCVFELGPHDALAHAELAFHGAAIRPAKGLLLRRVAADVSGADAAGGGWAARLLAAGFLPDRPAAWALQGLHLLQRGALEALLQELGGVAAMGSDVTGEVGLPEAAVRAIAADCGFRLDAYAPLHEVAAGLGREVPPEATRALFSATKTRLTGVQHERLQMELQRAEYDEGEEGFADAP